MPLPDLTQHATRRRSRSAGIVALAIAWFFAAHLVADRSASGITLRFGQSSLQPLVMAAFLLFLLFVGLLLVTAASRSEVSVRALLGLPRRPTKNREWGLGAALGWGATIVLLLPAVLTRSFHAQFWLTPRGFWLTLVALLSLALYTLAEEIVFRGYPFRRLIASAGPIRASILMSLLYALTYLLLFDSTAMSFTVAFVLGLLLSAGWNRTHGLWLPWGFHFAWKASLSILFGLPAAGVAAIPSVVNGQILRRAQAFDGPLGPEATTFTLAVLIGSLIVLFLVTREYAWNYTHPSITPGGYAVDIAPPAAHVAMDGGAAPPPPLVQILPSTPQTRSASDPTS